MVRVTESPPFTVTGVDFTGALYIKDREGETKVYICIFACAVTWAVHNEVVRDLTVQTFLLAFRRFSSRKSLPSVMISDNASTFMAAAEDLQRLFESEILQRERTPQRHLAIYTQTSTMVWWLLGTNGRSDKTSHQENTGKSVCHTPTT